MLEHVIGTVVIVFDAVFWNVTAARCSFSAQKTDIVLAYAASLHADIETGARTARSASIAKCRIFEIFYAAATFFAAYDMLALSIKVELLTRFELSRPAHFPDAKVSERAIETVAAELTIARCWCNTVSGEGIANGSQITCTTLTAFVFAEGVAYSIVA